MIISPSCINIMRRITLLLVGLLLIITAIICTVVEGAPDTTVLQAYCDQNSWQYGFYDEVVPPILEQLASDASADQNYVGKEVTQLDYYDPYVYNYAYGECNTAISPTECYDCLCAAASQLETNCYDLVGGVVKMADCMMEYANYDLSDE